MENNTPKITTTEPQDTSNFSNKKFDTMLYIVVFGFVFLGFILFFVGYGGGSIKLNIRDVNRILYYISEPRYWSILLAPVLWGVVFWFVIDCVYYFNFISKRLLFRLFVALITLLSMELIHGWVLNKIWQMGQILYYFYWLHIIGSYSNFILTGIWSWKILIMPVIVITAIIFLLIATKKYRRQK
ncbi:MAG: hypothetical protein LBP59_17550 [Planctomycetaceae bacterium]|jgi:hypothetical protein|nr:hypothetical protein [Planctomycetaceae bacterium]